MNDWRNQGQDPDYRFSLANERTFLAWIRTALAILAGAVLFHQFAATFRPAWVNSAISLGLAGFSALVAVGAYLRWKDNEVAMRHARPLPPSRSLALVAVGAALMAAMVLLVLGQQ